MFAWILDRKRVSGILFSDLLARLANSADPHTIEFVNWEGRVCRFTERQLRNGPEYLVIQSEGVRVVLCTNDSVIAAPGFFDLQTDEDQDISPDGIVRFAQVWYPDGVGVTIEVGKCLNEKSFSPEKRRKVIQAFLEGWPEDRPFPRLVIDDRLVRWGAYKKK